MSLTPQSMTALAKGHLAAAQQLLARVIAPPPGGVRTEANTLVPYDELRVQLEAVSAPASLHANVHPDPLVREAAEAAEREIAAFSTELSLDRALYEALAGVPLASLAADSRRFLERTLADFRRGGVDRDEATRTRLRALSDKAVELGQAHGRNIRDDVRTVQVEPAELAGLPEDYARAHPPGADGKVTITTDYPDAIPFMTYAQSARARRALHEAAHGRAWPVNDGVLIELLEVRRETATLLGYADFADLVTEDKMIGSGAKIAEFIDKVSAAAQARGRRDLDALLARKRRDVPDATTIDGSERAYYEELVKRERHAFDSQAVRPYFEFARTLDGLLTITSRLFDLTYVDAPDADLWHVDVIAKDVVQDGVRVGRIYLDLHPREGKYKHAAQFTVRSGVAGKQFPEGALVCNFPSPRAGGDPALMEHSDVVTLFHEFGHLMHHVLGGRQRWLYFSGVATEWDFVEAPSQMLEEWAWDHQTLALFARHHETGEVIPAELVARMREANEFGEGIQALHQMFYAALSLELHRAPEPRALDLRAVQERLQQTYSLVAYVPGTRMYASFGHLAGYSAMYYTYMWSLVIAKDMFSAFQREGLLDAEACRRYRVEVLAQGGARDAAELVSAFLGRPYGFDAFARWLDGNPA